MKLKLSRGVKRAQLRSPKTSSKRRRRKLAKSERRRRRLQPTTGYVVYRGHSALDGAPIVGVLTIETTNGKTGAMAQLWIIRADIEPHLAVKTGESASICGSCPLQGSACYVREYQAPLAIYRAYHRGRYRRLIGTSERTQVLRQLLATREIRLGAYGDPAALPTPLLEELVQLSAGHTGYSHQLLTMGNQSRAHRLAQLCMASVETPAQARRVVNNGWRFFGTIPVQEDLQQKALDTYAKLALPIVECPAYSHGTQCADCGLCQGASKQARNVVIPAHGAAKRSFKKFA